MTKGHQTSCSRYFWAHSCWMFPLHSISPCLHVTPEGSVAFGLVRDQKARRKSALMAFSRSQDEGED